MDEIRAFVAHTFAEDDKTLVSEFLEYFDGLSQSRINFVWQSAQHAESKPVAEKVLSAFAGKNVFIAICTKRERVVADAVLRPTYLPRGFLKAEAHQFSWKTSDWIIQEIGLAVGRDLKVIILLEEDVERPGGLIGDIEYIAFNRRAPQKSFVKLLQMINALSPRISGPTPAVSDTILPPTAAQNVTPEEEAREGNTCLVPTPDWSRRRYKIALIEAMATENTELVTKINESYLSTGDAARGDNKDSWEAFRELVSLRLGKGGTLTNLRKFAGAHPDSSGTLEHLADGYQYFEEHEQAARCYSAAAKKASDAAATLRLMGFAAVEYARAEMQPNVSDVVGQMRRLAEELPEGELRLLRVLRDLSEMRKDEEAAIAILERLVEIQPDENELRFALAHKCSQNDMKDLALFHYLKIPERVRGTAEWNNLGVAFETGGFPGKSVDAYRAAVGLKETLAMSNLAQKFMKAGFFAEAEEQCNTALTIENCHQNVASTLAELRGMPEEENKKQSELLINARPRSDFLRQFGRATSRIEPNDIAALWQGPSCDLAATMCGRNFNAVGSYELPPNALAGLLGIGMRGIHTSPTRMQMEYKGEMLGRAIKGVVTRKKEGAAPTTIVSGDGEEIALMVLSDDGKELKVMEAPTAATPRFYTIKSK